MKKFSLAVLAIAAALMMSQAVSAQNYDFTFSGADITALGTLYAPGTFGVTEGNATAGNIVVTGDSNLSGTGTLYASPYGPGVQTTSPSGYFYYDDTLYPGQNPSIDDNGLLFIDNGFEVNIFSNTGGQGYYQIYDNSGFTSGNVGTFTLTYVPEGGSFYMLILCALGLAGAFFYKGRQSGLSLNS
jgi:hypothetical protein